MFWNKIKYNAPEIILLGATAFLQFFRLGIGEILPWDESLYLIRAEACVKFGAWLDQTQYAIGGLYSSMHPPLGIWMMAILRMTFGNGVFSSRLLAALSAIAAIFFFYKITRRLFSRWTALSATVTLGSAQHFLWYAHHAQLDIAMFAFIVAATHFAIRSYEESGSKNAVIAGLLLGCALLTKAVQGLYLLPVLIMLPYIFKRGKDYNNVLIILGTAFLIAIPWYLYMFLHHPEFVGDYSELVRSMKTGTYSDMLEKDWTMQWWYYLNQTIINFPLIILGVLGIAPLFRKWKSRDTVYARLSLVVFLWFCSMLIFITSFPTRMLHFALFLLLPTSLLLSFFIEEFLQWAKNRRSILLPLLILLPVLGWSGSELIRKAIREHSFPDLHSEYLYIVTLIIGLGLLAWILCKKLREPSPVIILFIVSVFCISADYYRWAARDNEIYVDGAANAAKILMRPEIHSLTAYQAGSPHEAFLPQFNYYTNGWLIGWDSTKVGTTRSWDEIDSLIKANTIPKTDAAITYISWDAFYKPKQEEVELLSRIDKGLREKYKQYFHSKKYQLYWEPK